MILSVVVWKSDLLFLDVVLKPFGEVFCIGKIEQNMWHIHNKRRKNVKYSWFQFWLQTWIQAISTDKSVAESHPVSVVYWNHSHLKLPLVLLRLYFGVRFEPKSGICTLCVRVSIFLTRQKRLLLCFQCPIIFVCLQPLHRNFQNTILSLNYPSQLCSFMSLQGKSTYFLNQRWRD